MQPPRAQSQEEKTINEFDFSSYLGALGVSAVAFFPLRALRRFAVKMTHMN
jgi:hypothetical protein